MSEFVGSINVFTALVESVAGEQVTLNQGGREIRCVSERPLAHGDQVLISIRPEKLAFVQSANGGAHNTWEGQVAAVAYYGDHREYDIEVDDQRVKVTTPVNVAVERGERVFLACDPIGHGSDQPKARRRSRAGAMATLTGEVSLTAPRDRGRSRVTAVRINAAFLAMHGNAAAGGLPGPVPAGHAVVGQFLDDAPGLPGRADAEQLHQGLHSLDTYQVLFTTVLLVGAKTLVAVALATTLAWIVTRTDTPFRGTLEVLITLPFFIPGLLEAIAWIMLLSPNTGTINVWLRGVFGLSGAPFNIYSMGGMIWVMSLGSTSFIFLLVVNAMRNMDASLEESARASGAGAVRTALTVTMPLVAPIILSAGMLSFIRAMDSFEVPVLLGLPAKVFVFSNRIYAAVQYDYPVNYGLATALGVSFFGLMIGLIFIQNRLLRGKDFTIVTGKGYNRASFDSDISAR